MTRQIQLFALLSSIAFSSLAYATEEMLWVLMLAGSAVIHLSWRLALLLAGLLLMMGLSYRQLIEAYPNGGGVYFAVGEKLGQGAGVVVGGARLIAYLLTIGVSISAAVAALVSLAPALLAWRLVIALIMIGLLTLINLRAWRNVEKIVWPLTYFFVVLVLLVIVLGLTRLIMGRAAFGIGPLYYSLQTATVLILLLAAHVNYVNFCKLGQWMTNGRLSFTNSSLFLGLSLASLVIFFWSHHIRPHSPPSYSSSCFLYPSPSGNRRQSLALFITRFRHVIFNVVLNRKSCCFCPI